MPPTLLVIDDSPTVRLLTQLFLAPTGVTILEARDGQQGLEAARREGVDLIIADINMPGLDGLQLLKALRSDPDEKVRRRPVILTTSDESQTRLRAIAAGANAFLRKPVTGPQLLEVVAGFIPLPTGPKRPPG